MQNIFTSVDVILRSIIRLCRQSLQLFDAGDVASSQKMFASDSASLCAFCSDDGGAAC